MHNEDTFTNLLQDIHNQSDKKIEFVLLQ